MASEGMKLAPTSHGCFAYHALAASSVQRCCARAGIVRARARQAACIGRNRIRASFSSGDGCCDLWLALMVALRFLVSEMILDRRGGLHRLKESVRELHPLYAWTRIATGPMILSRERCKPWPFLGRSAFREQGI